MTDTLAIAAAVANLGPGWIIGHAAHTNERFFNSAKGRAEMFRRGCFAEAATRGAVVAINHGACRCDMPGRSASEPLDRLLDYELAYASTRNGSLLLAEDAYGLFFAALVDVHATIFYPGLESAPRNVHAAVANGVEVSIHNHGGRAAAVAAGDPESLRVYTDVNLIELSLLLPPVEHRAGSPGTWALPAGAAATAMLTRRVGSAAVRRS